MHPVIEILFVLINLFTWALILMVIVSWLVAFNVVNRRNAFVFMVNDFLYRITEPALGPIRRTLPNLGGIDISPLVLILGLYFLKRIIVWYF